jgi:hypothetical protein
MVYISFEHSRSTAEIRIICFSRPAFDFLDPLALSIL